MLVGIGTTGRRVGGGELAGLGLGGAGHAGQLVVQAEVILQCHRGPGVVLLFDGHPLLGLDGLVETVGPPAALERPPGELVDDLHLALLHQVVLVPLVEVLGREGLGQLVDVVDRHGVVDVLDPDRLLDLLDPRFERDDRLLLLIDLVVDITGERPGDGGELVIELRRLVGRTRDDEGRPCLVDEDGVDLVDDGEDVVTLGHQLPAARHVVAQVVEAEFVVGAVRDVRRVGRLLDGGIVDVGADAADRQAEPTVDPAHPLGVTGGQVLVDRHHVHATPVEGVEVGRQRGDERLALARLHFCDPAEVQRHAPHQLHVEVALAQDAPGRLAHHRVGLHEEVVEGLPLVEALLELHRLVGERRVAQTLHLGLEGADQRDEIGQPPDLLALAGAQDLGEHAHGGTILPAVAGAEPPPGVRMEMGLRAADLVFDPTLACREGDAPVPAARRRATAPNGTTLARIASSPPAPDSRGRSGQGLPLSRTMLSDHKSPYVGRFACDWPRLSTTDPHAARRQPTPPGDRHQILWP